jgi:hypothetical protein
MQQNVIVTGVGKPYDFENENGDRIKGAKVYFYIENYSSDGELGFVPRSVSVSLDVYQKMQSMKFPFLAELVFEKQFKRGGFVDKIVDFSYLEHYDSLFSR